MRIAIYHNLPSGGAKRALYEWTCRLIEAHEVHVFTLSEAEHGFCDIRPLVQCYRVWHFTPHKLFRRPFGRLNRLQRWRDLGTLERLGSQIAAEINRAGYDVVFVQPCRHVFIPPLIQFLQVPAVYYLHEPFGPTFRRHFRRPYLGTGKLRDISMRIDPLYILYNRKLEKLRRDSVKQTARLLANSKFTAEQISLAYGVNAHICPYGVDSKAFRPIQDVRKENCVISVGEMTPRKGFDFLIESLGAIPIARRPALKLICNWVSSEEHVFLEQLAAKRGVALDVLVNLGTERLTIEYNRASLCLYAPIMEPFGLVPLESMACGTPVVGVREGGVRETVVHGVTGLLVERDPRLFAEAVDSLLQDPKRREQLGQQGIEYVRREWTWERSIAELERHLSSVAAH